MLLKSVGSTQVLYEVDSGNVLVVSCKFGEMGFPQFSIAPNLIFTVYMLYSG